MEILILHLLSNHDQYGYELIENLNRIFVVNGNSVYPFLHRFHKQKFVETYLEESPAGAPRKYYKMTEKGRSYYLTLISSFCDLAKELGLERKQDK